jgi:hypothetical protein
VAPKSIHLDSRTESLTDGDEEHVLFLELFGKFGGVVLCIFFSTAMEEVMWKHELGKRQLRIQKFQRRMK